MRPTLAASEHERRTADQPRDTAWHGLCAAQQPSTAPPQPAPKVKRRERAKFLAADFWEGDLRNTFLAADFWEGDVRSTL